MAEQNRVIIIGAGASGLAAAVSCADAGGEVTVLEAGKKPAEKLRKTGNGKCNLMHFGPSDGAYCGADPSFAEQVCSALPEEELLAFLLGCGIPVNNKNGLGYPWSEQAQGVSECLIRAARKKGARIRTSTAVTGIGKEAQCFCVFTGDWSYPADRVILACGSPASVPGAPSSGMLFLAEEAGLPVTPFYAALVPLRTEELPLKEWAGVRHDGCARLYADGQFIRSETGQFQFTDSGISGIAVFNLSLPAAPLLSEGKRVELELDFFPEKREDGIRGLIGELLPEGEADCKDALRCLLPERMLPWAEGLWLKHGASGLAAALKGLRFRVSGTGGISRAQVCGGGVLTGGISSRTMESAACPGLFVTGEMLDVTGICGGWNLGFAFRTGILAGRAAARQVLKSL